MALAIIAQEQKQQEQSAGSLNKYLETQLGQVKSEKRHLHDYIQDLEDQLANDNADLISKLRGYVALLEESTEEASWTVAGLRGEICQLERSVDRKNITKISTALQWERSCTYRLHKENYCLREEIDSLQA
jgi:hypothetical protein